MRLFTIVIMILLIATTIFCCTSKYKVDSFMDFSCDAVQNKYYQPEELIYKSNCPNLVIVQKNTRSGRPIFFAEYGDENGPYWSRDYVTYYYLGESPHGLYLDLDYDLYYRPFYNPLRWLYGRYDYVKRKKNTNFKDGWYKPWKSYHNKLEYKKALGNKRMQDKYKNKKNNNIKNSNKALNKTPIRTQKKTYTLHGASARL